MKNADSKSYDALIPTTSEEYDALAAIWKTLLEVVRVDFTQYRQSTVMRRLTRRMKRCKKNSFKDYYYFMKGNRDEINLLYSDLLLHFTEFFRDPHIFEVLKEKVFPQLIKNRSAKSPIRIWVPGCSTGEEVYSLAICLHEFLKEHKPNVTVQFFGTDLSSQNIAVARAAFYPDKIRKNVSSTRLERFFDPVGDSLKVVAFIRETCVFAVQDITSDPPFPNMDLVSCRNVFIYFNNAFQEISLPLFHFALKPTGFLMLGTSESMGKFHSLFNLFDQKANIYSKRKPIFKPVYRFPFSSIPATAKVTHSEISMGMTTKTNNVELTNRIEEILLESFAPPCVLVDSDMQIRRFRGSVSPYLGPSPGEASLKLSKMAEVSLMPDLYAAIEEAKKKQSKVKKKNITFKRNKDVDIVDITVVPAPNASGGDMYYLILFEKPDSTQPLISKDDDQSNEVHNQQHDNLKHLSAELQKTKGHLQSIIEEKEGVNQELWAANEEVQSTNEELQSINEELEASKEELEAGNEELLALNEELREKNLQLEVANEFSQNLLETANVLIVTLDKQANITSFNKYAEKLTLHKKDEVIGKNWFDFFIPQRNRDELSMMFGDALNSMPQAFQHENQILIKDGQERLISWRNNITRNSEGDINGILSIGADVTEQKKLERSLIFTQFAVDNSKDAIFWMGSDVKIVYANNSACHQLGYTQTELLTMSAKDITVGWKLELWKHSYKIIKEKGFLTVEALHRKKDGSTFPVEVVAQMIYFDGREYICSIIRNISDRKKMSDQLRQSEKMEAVGQLAGGIAHDFNNQLAGIMGYADILREDLADNMKLAHRVDNILLATRRAADLTSQLLAFSRKGKYRNVPVDMHRIIFEVVNLLQHSIDKKIEVRQNLRANPAETMGDPSQLQSTVLNLALNARDAMPNGGTLTFSTEIVSCDEYYCEAQMFDISPGKYLQISVVDSGEGMDEETQKKIFEPFFTTKDQGKGTGMGLAAVYGTVKNHKGFIFVDSAPRCGSTFTLHLPAVAKESAMERHNETSRESVPGVAHIMIVDDDQTVCNVGATMLKSLGYTVSVCMSGEEAVKQYRELWRTIDLVLLDVIMPIMDGKEVFLLMRQINPDIVALISSGYSIDGKAEDILNEGARGFIQKPYRNSELSRRISEILKTSG